MKSKIEYVIRNVYFVDGNQGKPLTAEYVRHHLKEHFDVERSHRQVSTCLNRMGLNRQARLNHNFDQILHKIDVSHELDEIVKIEVEENSE